MMRKSSRSIAAAILAAMALAGCSGEGGTPSVPSGAGADSAAKKAQFSPPAEKTKGPVGPSSTKD